MEALDEILNSRTAPGVFHPVQKRDSRAWFPGNETASLLLQCQYVWDDIGHLSEMYRQLNNDYQKKLILKYVFIELRSFLEVFDRLQTKVMQATVFNPADRLNRPYRGITHKESQLAKALYKTYANAKAITERAIIQVRNNIGAHRGNLNWQEVMTFWDTVSVVTIQPLLDAIPPVFEHIKELNIYEWHRAPTEGTIEILGTVLYPEDFEPDDS
ncbi:hypothetical protein [Herbaspirillum sp.]|uniref:hypothetical protein n=1 Tax=Herbaspirillum sp. TaxID=1890675 RepID=UPI0031E3EA96